MLLHSGAGERVVSGALIGAARPLPPAQAGGAAHKRDVEGRGRKIPIDIRVLRHVPEPVAEMGKVGAIKGERFAVKRWKQAHQGAHKGGLAGAVSAHEAGDGGGSEGKGGVGKQGRARIACGEVGGAQH